MGVRTPSILLSATELTPKGVGKALVVTVSLLVVMEEVSVLSPSGGDTVLGERTMGSSV